MQRGQRPAGQVGDEVPGASKEAREACSKDAFPLPRVDVIVHAIGAAEQLLLEEIQKEANQTAKLWTLHSLNDVQTRVRRM